MKKELCLLALLLVVGHSFASAQPRVEPICEVSVGAGVFCGPAITVMPAVLLTGVLENGFFFGPGIGMRAGYVTKLFNNFDFADVRKRYQQEADLSLFYRVGYAKGRIHCSLDFGGSTGLYAFYKESEADPINKGLFFEPQIGWKLTPRMSLSLGVLFHQGTYAEITAQGDMLDQETKTGLTPAITLHYSIVL